MSISRMFQAVMRRACHTTRQLPLFLLTASLMHLSLLLPAPAWAIDLTEASKAVVKLFVTRQTWNLQRPWTKNQVVKSSCTGFFIPQGILTNAHCVSDATYIELEFPGVADKVEAEVKAVNHQVDLALIDLKDQSLRPDVTVISFDALPELRDKVVTVGYPLGGRQVSYTEGVVSRIDIMVYAHSGIGSLMVQTDAAINSGNSGGPVFSDKTGASLGVATQRSSRGEALGYFIPAPVVNQFLQDIEDDKVDGIPALGAFFQAAENPALRRSLKMSDDQSGVRVIAIVADSSADGVLQKDDVILSIEGHQIYNDGRVPFRDDGKIDMGYYVTTRQVGDKINMEVLRDGKQKKLSIKQKPYDIYIIPKLPKYGTVPRFFEIGGLLFQPVEQRYLHTLGKNIPGSLTEFFGGIKGEINGLEELVVITDVYDAQVNKGYSGMVENQRILSVNGITVNTLNDVINGFNKNTKGDYHVIELVSRGRIVLDKQLVKNEQHFIRQRYNITVY